MGLRFLSREWLEESKRLVSHSPEFQKVISGLTTNLLTVVENPPRGRTLYLYYEFDQGTLSRMELLANGGTQRPSVAFLLTGRYDTFVQLQQGTLSPQAAYFQRLVKIQGNFQQAMRFAPAFLKYHELVRRVETEY